MIGKALHKSDLPIRKRLHLLAIDAECPKHGPGFAQWNDKERADAAEIGGGAGQGIADAISFRTGEIGDLNESLGSPEEAQLHMGRAVWPPLEELCISLWRTADCRSAHKFTVIGPKYCDLGLARSHRLFQDCVEHRREIGGRRIDDLQNLGGRHLLSQRLTKLGAGFVQLALEFRNRSLGIGR